VRFSEGFSNALAFAFPLSLFVLCSFRLSDGQTSTQGVAVVSRSEMALVFPSSLHLPLHPPGEASLFSFVDRFHYVFLTTLRIPARLCRPSLSLTCVVLPLWFLPQKNPSSFCDLLHPSRRFPFMPTAGRYRAQYARPPCWAVGSRT